MPTYEYACERCGDLRFDRFVVYEHRDDPMICPNCADSDMVERKLPICSFQSKGGYDSRMKTIKEYKTK